MRIQWIKAVAQIDKSLPGDNGDDEEDEGDDQTP